MKLIGVLMILGGIALGLYVGLWLCFIGGIVAIINLVQAPGAIDAMALALNVLRVLAASAAGSIVAYALIIPGLALLVRK